MSKEAEDFRLGDWNLKVREPADLRARKIIFLVHGWTGDENSMWVFAPKLPKDVWLIAPRAPYPSIHEEYGGYSWVKQRSDIYSQFDDFAEARDSFDDLLVGLAKALDVEVSRFGMTGFSQGAAFCYSYALTRPERMSRFAGLAGFFPAGRDEMLAESPLSGKNVFLAHGSADETVPVKMAKEAKDKLEKAGASVDYCEAAIGHKLAAECFRALAEFWKDD